MAIFRGTDGDDILPPANQSNAGNDHFIPLLGSDVVDGGAGRDILTIDYSSITSDVYGIVDSSNNLAGQLFAGDWLNDINFTNIEQLRIKTGSGNDYLSFTGNSLAGSATLAVDAGAGFDRLGLDIAGLSGNTHFLASGPNVVTNRGSFRNFEAYSISVGDGNDVITTGSGDDDIYGGNGNNTLNGGLGNDVIVAGTGNDRIVGGGGNDTITGGTGRNLIFAGDGDDVIGALGTASGIDRVNGGDGYDIWAGDYSAELMALRVNVLGNGTATISNGTSVRNIELFEVSLGGGNDKVFTSGGFLNIYDSSLTDYDTTTVDYSASSNNVFGRFEGSSTVALSGIVFGDYPTESINFSGMEKVSVSTGMGDDDLIVMGDRSYLQNLTINAGIGSDILNAYFDNAVDDFQFSVVGNSTQTNFGIYKNFETFNIRTGSGNDSVITAAGDDGIDVGSGSNIVNSGSGNDRITTYGNGSFDGGEGVDNWSGYHSESNEDFSIIWNNDGSGSISNGTTLNNIERMNFSTGYGTDTADLSGFGVSLHDSGYGDSDSVIADISFSSLDMYVNSVLSGNSLSASIGTEYPFQSMGWANYEQETIITGSGDDRFTVLAVETSSSLFVALDAGAGIDTLFLNASGRNSSIAFEVNGSEVNTSLGQFTNFENFIISGSSGNDVITTGAGDDGITGGIGDDFLNGGGGADSFFGGAGSDTFRFTDLNFGADQIVEFVSGEDLLSFSFNVADSISDFSITGNGTNQVIVALGNSSITLDALGPLTLTDSDFVFI